MFDEASRSAPALVTTAQLGRLSVTERKLEQVLGRLWRVIGWEALECLRCLRVVVPNEAHMLAALHLARGGTHATVNLDRGIEVAYALIAGMSEVPRGWSEEYRQVLRAWQAAAGTHPHPLREVASRAEFDAWVEDGKPPALLKIHGSLPVDDGALVDVVVEDTEELGGLTPGRLAAVNHLAGYPTLVVTGYGGLDPDVYRPLLRAAQQTRTVWATRSIVPGSQLDGDLAAAGIDRRIGDPDGLATTAIGDLLGTVLPWPDVRPTHEPGWRDHFSEWRASLRSHVPPEQFALAWAWLLADSGDGDGAVALLESLTSGAADPVVCVRLADALYDRAEANDRDRANRLYWGLASNKRVEWALRGHCLLRIGGIARGRAVREGGWRRAPNAVVALSMPLVVLAAQRWRRDQKDPELSAAAKATLGQTILRGCEGLLPSCPRAALPMVAAALRQAARMCRDASRASTNGNRRALANSHGLLAQALSSLVVGDDPDPAWTDELEDLVAAYVNAGDFPGAGNCYSALAVVAAATNDWALAEHWLNRARTFYSKGRPEHRLIPAGSALVNRLERVLSSQGGAGRSGTDVG